VNEFTALMILLTRSHETTRGAPAAEILKALHWPEKLGRGELQKKLTEFDTYLQPLGLQVRLNPLNDFWFVAFRQDISEFAAQNPFGGRPRLPATLLATIICMIKYGNRVPISAVREIRKKETVLEDLKQLEDLGFVAITGDNLTLTPLIGYQLDLISLFEAINDQMTKKSPTADSSIAE
jgi:hypothetical protein